MIDHQQSPNWVAHRGRCNLDLTFEALCQVVERDVGEMNKLSPQIRRGHKFTLEKKGEGTAPMLQAEGNPRDGKIDIITLPIS